MKADRVANKAYVSLDENVLVAEAAKTMYQREECTIIVTRNDKAGLRVPVGIVTERDIIFRVVAQNRGPFKITLKDIMTSPIITADSKVSVNEALSIMKERKISRLPLLKKEGVVVGLLTAKALVKSSPVKIAQA